jgi:16S rRNA (cytosine1407-C5)-methyltransferase
MAADLPDLFVERLRRIVPAARWDDCLASFGADKPTSFRVNRIKARPDEVLGELAAAGLCPDPVAWCGDAFCLAPGPDRRRRLTETAAVAEGRIYIQDLASVAAPAVLDPQPDEMVLDLAAAPGGKTLHMAALMDGRGTLAAVESVRSRFFRLKANLQTCGATWVRTYLTDGRSVGRKTPERFDRVLLDAPCSGESRFCRSDPKTWRYWSLKKIREAARKQRGLIRSALRALKPGGLLLYCTCSFAPEENERVIHDLLTEKPHEVELVPVRLPLENVQPGLTDWDSRSLHPHLDRAARILPTDRMDGLFLCLLRKPAGESSPS